MKKKLILVLALICAMSQAFAQSTLNVHQKSGGTISYAFSEKPVVSYSGNSLVLTTAKVNVEYPLSNLDKLTFEDGEANAIDQMSMEAPADAVTHIYNISGVLVKSVEASKPISTDDLTPGVYVITNGKTTYKIIKK